GLGTEFLPELNGGSFYVAFTLPGGVSLSEGRRWVPRISAMFRDFPEVRQVLSQLGRPEDGTDPTLTNNAEFFVDLLPQSKWRKDVTRERMIADRSARFHQIPGVQ